MELQDLWDHVNRGALIEGGPEEHAIMHHAAQEAPRIVAKTNRRAATKLLLTL